MKSIVAGIDFTGRSRDVLTEAFRRCEPGASVHAVHVVDQRALDEVHGSADRSAEDIRGQILLDTKRLLEAHLAEKWIQIPQGIRLIVEVRAGDPPRTLAEYAEKAKADLIVMARNSRSNPDLGAGSTAVQTVRHATGDVLIVHENAPPPYRHVVSCIDFSEHSERALRSAAIAARNDGATLHLLHAYRPYWEVIHLGALPIDATAEIQNEQRILLEQRLARLAKTAKEAVGGGDVKWHIVPAGSAASALLEFFKDIGADLAVVASHGRTGLSRMVLGSVAERIVRHSPCSVFVCKARFAA